jgi:hypothetical protein
MTSKSLVVLKGRRVRQRRVAGRLCPGKRKRRCICRARERER